MLMLNWILVVGLLLGSWIIGLIGAAIAKRALDLPLGLISIFLFAVAGGILLGTGVNAGSVLFLIVGLYWCVNNGRLITDRLQRNHLRRVVVASSWQLLIAELAVIAAACFWPKLIRFGFWVVLAALVELALAATFLVIYFRASRRSRPHGVNIDASNDSLPSLTVAVPAKNENIELLKCLESVVASDYPKLEILVLDDSAGNRTGDIINSLAHEGVRFILGESASNGWLAKNLAYDRLAKEANGDLILFCGVDVRFEKSSLRQLVLSLSANGLDMLSVMPQNVNQPRSLMVQPMRYFWELARPHNAKLQPVLSTCWLVRRKLIESNGGFAAVKREIVPERHIAQLAIRAQGYRFLRAGSKLGVFSQKKPDEMRRTAIRTRYPLLHHRPEAVLGVSLSIAACQIGSLGLVVCGLIFHLPMLAILLSAAAALSWVVIYADVLKKSFSINFSLAPIFFIAAFVDLLLLNLSMLKYEFGTVIWKGHDVTGDK